MTNTDAPTPKADEPGSGVTMRIYFEKQWNGNYDVVCDTWYTPEIPRSEVVSTIEMFSAWWTEHLQEAAAQDIDWSGYHEFASSERKP